MTSTLDILITARERISDPDQWGKGMRAHRDDPTTCCIVEAIEDRFFGPERIKALCALVDAAGIAHRNYGTLPNWNDAPHRKHVHALALYDKAIAAERARA